MTSTQWTIGAGPVRDARSRRWWRRRPASDPGAGSVPPAGQPFRARYLDEIVAHITGHERVWHATTDDVAARYAATTPARAPVAP